MDYLTPPTTPKKQRTRESSGSIQDLHGHIKSATISPMKTENSDSPNRVKDFGQSPDRFIPNRAHVDFDYCNNMLSPSRSSTTNTVEAKKKITMENYVSSALMSSNKSNGKRMIEVFQSADSVASVSTESSFKVMYTHLYTYKQLRLLFFLGSS